MEERPAETYIHVCRRRMEPDWAHAPLPFKLYRNCVRIPLSRATLGALSAEQIAQHPTYLLGLFLHELYGMVRMSDHRDLPQAYIPGGPGSTSPWLGRPVASGGARFPGELYLLALGASDPAPGLYHYDPLHHTLDLVYSGQFFPDFCHALARPPEKLPTYALLYSSLFWKNACKYQEFSYRLQGLDIGCLLAQTQVVSERYGWRSSFHFRFLDEQLNRLLGFHPLEESVYAVVVLEEDEVEKSIIEERPRPEPEISLAPELPSTLEQYKPLSQWPLLEAVHRASLIQTPEELYERRTVPSLPIPASTSDLVIHLPHVASSQLGTKMAERRSAWAWEYRARPVTREQLACLLQAAVRGYYGDLDGNVPRLPHTLLYCLINQVEQVPPGIYVYQPEQHLIQRVVSGDVSPQFQDCQTDPGWNMRHVSLALIPVGNYAQGFTAYGDRWYRMQNMEAGLCVQRLYLTAALNDLVCRSQLSYNDRRLDALLALPADYTGLIQILISPRDPDKPPHKGDTLWIRW